ncbi:hypothetical protein [Lysobacter arvi]|uniref:Uncharacterized protein n=1 Tax=Lysobacter arvi TaxID=3038776 RepID=A0ABU1CGX8_9GAMM|nr:hypothetical protein [Lysobacter arvi]MDR0184216.1 hypothetical protein [Lysobacter arvi]
MQPHASPAFVEGNAFRGTEVRMIRVVGWFSIFTVLVLVAITLMLLTLPRDPMRQPGVSWSSGFLAGYTVRLLDSGRYVNARWCDICPEERSYGTWEATETGYRFHPDSGEPPWRLQRVLRRGCIRLTAPPDAPSRFPVFFKREGDTCEHTPLRAADFAPFSVGTPAKGK